MKSGRRGSLIVLSLVIGFAAKAQAQNFKETEDLWKTETIRTHNMDTVRIERHSFFALAAINDTIGLTYHEPLPDSVMPKTAIEIGQITVQASSAEDVLAMLEKQARAAGADWIVSFNEPRLKFTNKGEPYYRSQAMLYKVINPELVTEDQIAEVNCNEEHLKSYTAIQNYMKHIVAKTSE